MLFDEWNYTKVSNIYQLKICPKILTLQFSLRSIQSYSCLRYGNIAYHVTVALSAIANPAACFLAFFVQHTSIRLINQLTVASIVIAIYGYTTSVISTPPLQNTWMGIFLVVSILK